MAEPFGRILVTGAGGFIGSHVVRRFAAAGWEVFGLVHRRRSASPVEGVAYRQGDVTCREVMERLAAEIRPDVIVHVAALASDVGPEELFRRLNYESVIALAPLARKFVFLSTADVFGIRDFHDEDVSTLEFHDNTGNPYPRWKIAAERWLQANLPPERFACVRPAAVWGEGDETLERRTVEFLRRSPFIVHFGKWKGRNRWPLADVRRVAEAAYLCATTTRWDGGGVTVIDPGFTTADEYYRSVAARHFPSRRYRTLCLPGWLGALLGRTSSFIARLFRMTHVPFDPSYYAYLTVSSNLDFVDRSFIYNANHALAVHGSAPG